MRGEYGHGDRACRTFGGAAYGWAMRRSAFGWIGWLAWGLLSPLSAQPQSIAEIRRLPPEVVATNPAVTLTANVIFVAVWKNRTEIAVHDGTAGIYTFVRNGGATKLKLGDELHLTGTVQAGMGPPCLSVDSFTFTGGYGLPDAKVTDFAALENGSMDSQFVEIEGIVRDVQYDPAVAPPSSILTLQMKGGRAEVFAALKPAAGLEKLVDSVVRVRAVPFHYFNQSRQPFGFRLMTCDDSQIEVFKNAPQPPFEMPVTRVEQLLRYRPVEASAHRVRVQGVVTLHWPGEFFYLQDGKVGILVKSRRMEPLKPGDRVDVAAFASISGYSAILEDADFRKVGRDGSLAAVHLSLHDLVAGGEDARLVTTEGVLESVSEKNGRAVLMVRAGPLIVPAEIPVGMTALPTMIPGSRVKLTGVCQVELGSRRKFAAVYRPESARLLLRSIEDVKVVEQASWWTVRRLAYALSAMLVVLIIAMIWASGLQSRNQRLKKEILARQEAEAEVRRREEERKILATDLHDSLEQSLTGVALQLQAAGKQSDNEHLELAKRLLKHSREEVHRAVRDLREPFDGELDLGAALAGLIKRSSAGSAVDFSLDLPERLPEIAGHLGPQLLHLAQEGITNALKHADAASIRIGLKESGEQVVLEIEDDGRGFDVADRPGPADGHFGLQGMKERAARLQGTISIDSKADDGTRIRIVLPKNP